MALTTEEFNQLVIKVTEALQSNATGVSDVPQATDLDGVASLPSLKIKNGQEQVVLVPLKLLSDPVYAAIKSAEPAYANYCKNLYAEYVTKLLQEAQKYYPIKEDGWHFIDSANNVEVSITDNGLDASKLGDNIKTLIASIPGLGLKLGVTSDTAYPGDRGNTAYLLGQSLKFLLDLILQVQEDGFTVTDAAGNIGMRYDNNGLDSALLSSHLIELIKGIEGIGLKLGVTSDTAYPGDRGNELANKVKKLEGSQMSNIIEVDEDGIFFVDKNYNIVVKVDNTGINWSKSDSAGLNYEVIEELN